MKRTPISKTSTGLMQATLLMALPWLDVEMLFSVEMLALILIPMDLLSHLQSILLMSVTFRMALLWSCAEMPYSVEVLDLIHTQTDLLCQNQNTSTLVAVLRMAQQWVR